MRPHQQPWIALLFKAFFLLSGGLSYPLALNGEELESEYSKNQGVFAQWRFIPPSTISYAQWRSGLGLSSLEDLDFLPWIPLTRSSARDTLWNGDDFFLPLRLGKKAPFFFVAEGSNAVLVPQSSSVGGEGGSGVILSPPGNNASSVNGVISPFSPNQQVQPGSPGGPPAPTIVIEPSMPGFDETRGIEAYVPGPLPGSSEAPLLSGPWLSDWARTFLFRNLLVFFGVHGFKGPMDLGHSGNFGFHEGVNWGAPLWEPWGWGFQLGMEALHSNFLGTQAVDTGFGPPLQMADRHQIFFTGGVFQRRLDQGMQGGVAVDIFYDHYYDDTTLCQLRSETSIVFNPYHELGYWGAYALSRTALRGTGDDAMIRPNDLFALFYRRRFTGGGLGRIWTGLSSYGDLVLGLEGTVPLGTQWAIDNNFTCLFPKHGRSAGDRPEECWSVSIHLVWYPGRASNPVVSNPYHPLFYVADNSWFLVKRRP